MTLTMDSESKASRLPVSSNASTTPVTGALTTPAKSPAMPSTMKLVMSFPSMPSACVAVVPNKAPARAPMITSGNSVPPGVPAPKQTPVKRNLPKSSRPIAASESPWGLCSSSRIASPPHMRSGKNKAATPASSNGMMYLSSLDGYLTLARASCIANMPRL